MRCCFDFLCSFRLLLLLGFVTNRQKGEYGELLVEEGGDLARLMEAFAEDGSEDEVQHSRRNPRRKTGLFFHDSRVCIGVCISVVM